MNEEERDLRRRCKEGWERPSRCRPRRTWDLQCILDPREVGQLEVGVRGRGVGEKKEIRTTVEGRGDGGDDYLDGVEGAHESENIAVLVVDGMDADDMDGW